MCVLCVCLCVCMCVCVFVCMYVCVCVLCVFYDRPTECVIKPLGQMDILNNGRAMYSAVLTYTFHVVSAIYMYMYMYCMCVDLIKEFCSGNTCNFNWHIHVYK